MTARFSAENVQAGHGDITIIPAFDLECDAGTVVAILGPNGAGKTTLMTTLAGLLDARDGTVRVDGEVVRNGHPNEASKAGIVLVPDDRALFTTLTVDENLRAARGRRNVELGVAYELFPALVERRRVDAGNLSGGEQQMLAVARAIVQEPKVLLIDEMSMGLAPVIVERMLPLVRTIAEERGAVVVIVEQHVGLAMKVADRAVVLTHGEVVLDRPAAALAADPQILERAYFGSVAERDEAASSDVTTGGTRSRQHEN